MAAAWFKQSSLLVLVYLASSAVLMVPVSWSWIWHSTSPPSRVAHLHLFMHDVLVGENTTATVVVNGTGEVLKAVPPLRFGHVVVMDDVLTESPSPTSRSVGRTQGFYVFSAMDDPALLFCMNMVLTAGPYNGSTVTVTGRDHITEPLRELSVVGGTGMFRMATGYVLWRTSSWELLHNAVLELDLFIHMHPSVPA